MAQWLGQFSGRTHATAIADAEALLEHAVAEYRAATDETRPRKAKAVRKLAQRVLTARRRPLRTSVQDHATLSGTADARELQRLEEGGIAAILEEFGCKEALMASSQAKQ